MLLLLVSHADTVREVRAREVRVREVRVREIRVRKVRVRETSEERRVVSMLTRTPLGR